MERVVLVIKRTALAAGGRVAAEARGGHAAARRIVAADAEHERTVGAVRRALARRGLAWTEVFPSRLSQDEKRRLAAADFVVSVGGDGTLLAASHHVERAAVLGVNSAPRDSVGHFCSTDRRTFAAALEAILAGRKALELSRLVLDMDGRRLKEPALNDFLIVHECPAATTRYRLGVGRRVEEHRSSGLWIATPAGSTAGIRSAGGRAMPRRSRRFQYLVRELYRERGRRYALRHGFVPKGAALTVTSKMREGRIYVDGARTCYRFPFGAAATVRLAEEGFKLYS